MTALLPREGARNNALKKLNGPLVGSSAIVWLVVISQTGIDLNGLREIIFDTRQKIYKWEKLNSGRWANLYSFALQAVGEASRGNRFDVAGGCGSLTLVNE